MNSITELLDLEDANIIITDTTIQGQNKTLQVLPYIIFSSGLYRMSESIVK